jgi:hypothetical protein
VWSTRFAVPFVELQVRLRAGRSILDVGPVERTEEGFERVQRVHAEVAQRVGALRDDRRQRPARICRIVGAAQDVDHHDVAARARRDDRERLQHDRIETIRMIHRQLEAALARERDQRVALGDRFRERLLHEHVAAHLERLFRDGEVGRRWREHVHRMRLRVREAFERFGDGRDAMLAGERPRRFLVRIAQSDELHERQSRQRCEVMPGDVARADDCDPQFRSLVHVPVLSAPPRRARAWFP